MNLNTLDWTIVGVFFVLLISIGIYQCNAGKGYNEFFFPDAICLVVKQRSMVATTFSCDTPNLVTDIVRQNGVAGNWLCGPFIHGNALRFLYMQNSEQI